MTTNKFNESLVSYALVTVPLYAVYFALKESPFDYTMSMIGNWFDNRINFIIWGVVTATLLLISIIHIYNKTKFENKKARQFAKLSMLFLILTVITPTAHNQQIYDELNQGLFYVNLHGVFGFMFGIFLLLSLFLFSKYLSVVNKEMSIKSIRLLLITVGGSVITLFIFGMTGIFELFFFLFLSAFLITINRGVKKNKKSFK